MKKFISLLLTATMALSGTACSNQNTEPMQTEPTSPPIAAKPLGLEGEIGGEINISCYNTLMYKNYLEEAAKAFQEKYANTKVNIETFSALPETKTTTLEDGTTLMVSENTNDEQAEKDYITKINTELMGGSGADILAMDVLPFYKYAESGQLEDLSRYMETDETFAKEDYRQSVLDAAKYKGGQYLLPMDFSFEYLNYDESLFNEKALELLKKNDSFTYDELITIGQESFEAVNATAGEPIKMFNTYENFDIFHMLFKQNYTQFIDIENRTANFGDGKFVKLLETIKSYGDKGYLKAPAEMADTSDAQWYFNENASTQYFYKTNPAVMLFNEFNINKGMKSFAGPPSNTEHDKIAGMLTNDAGEIPFTYYQAYGMNSNSQNKRTAWEFIKFLTSEEMQTSLNLLGRPINNKAFTEKAKLEVTGAYYAEDRENARLEELTDEEKEAFDSYLAALNRYSNLLNTYPIQDNIVSEMIYKEIDNYFDGTKTAVQVADALQSKVDLYLNE